MYTTFLFVLYMAHALMAAVLEVGAGHPYENGSWSGPSLPVPDDNNIVQQNPLFKDSDNDDFSVGPQSPVGKAGYSVPEPVEDYFGNKYSDPPSIGAVEAFPIVPIKSNDTHLTEKSVVCHVVYNPSRQAVIISATNKKSSISTIGIYTVRGRKILSQPLSTACCLPVNGLSAGVYIFTIHSGEFKAETHTLIIR
jgi:hypothetical protein